MDNTRTDVSAAPSAARQSTTNSSKPQSNYDSMAASYFGSDFGDTPDSSSNFESFEQEEETSVDEHLNAEDDVDAELSESEDESAISDPEDSDTEESQTSEKEEEKAASRTEKRIQAIIAQKKQVEQKFKEQTLIINRMNKAFEIQQEVMSHLAKKANVTDADVDLINKHLENRINSSEQEVVEQTNKEYEAHQSAQIRSEKVQEVLSAMKEAHEEWSDLFSMHALATFMKENKMRDASAAAKKLGEKLLLASSKRMKSPDVPNNASARPTGARATHKRDEWKTSNDLLDMYNHSANMKTGRN